MSKYTWEDFRHQRDKSTISRHIKNIFAEGELAKDSVVANFAKTAADGKTYQVDYYNLDVIISVPFIKYMLQMVLACYVEFEDRVDIMSGKGSKSTAYDIVKAYMMGRIGKMTGAEVGASCPSAGRSAVLGAIKRLTEEGLIFICGAGRSTYYVRADSV